MLLRELTPPSGEPPTKLSTAAKSTNVSRNMNVCRCLFGRASSDVSSVQACLNESSRRRWNFDFAAMQPLSRGRFEWTRGTTDAQFLVPLSTSSGTSMQSVVDADAPMFNAAGLRATSDTADDVSQFASPTGRLLGPRTATPVPLSASGYMTTPSFTSL